MIEIASDPYIYEGTFTNDKGETVQYFQLRVDVKIGSVIKPLTYKLRGFEAEYIRSLIESAD